MAKASGVSVGEGGKGMGAATVNMLCCGCAAVLSRQARQDLRCAYAEHVHGVDVSLILDQFGELITCPVKEGDGAALYSLEKASTRRGKTQKVETFTATDLCQEALRRLSASLQEEHKLEYCPIADLRLSFTTTPLSVSEHVTHAKGRFTEFLEQKCGLIHVSTSHAFNCLIEELRKRCNCEDAITSISELAQKKGMTKKEFEQRINTISKAALPEKWKRFEAILIQEGVDVIRLGRFQKAWETHQVQRLDTTNGILQEASVLVAKAFDALHAEMHISPLMPFLAALQARCIPILQSRSIPFKDETIAAIAFTHLDGLSNES